MAKVILFLLCFLLAAIEAIEARRYPTSNSYLDSYHYNGHVEDNDEFSGDAFNYGNLGAGTGSRFDFEGSGLGGHFDDDGSDDDSDEGSGAFGGYLPTEEIYPHIPYQPHTTSGPPLTTTTASIYDDWQVEGSGGGHGDDEDGDDDDDEVEEGSGHVSVPSIPMLTIPTTVDPNDIFFDSTSTETTTTTTTTSTPATTSQQKTSVVWTEPPVTTEITTTRRRKTTVTTTTVTTVTSTTTETRNTTSTCCLGPNKEKLPSWLVDNRLLVILLFSGIVLCLVLLILSVLCMLIRYRKRPPSEVASSDTASSDLPIIKADAKRYQIQAAAARHRTPSDSPPPLPDLNLFDNDPKPKLSDQFNRKGSIRKSKRDSKTHLPHNPNWL